MKENDNTIFNNEHKSMATTTNSTNNFMFMEYTFSLLLYRQTRAIASQFMETLILHMPMFDLNKIQNIRGIISQLDPDGLSSACRIFSITLTDLKINDKKYWTNAQKQKVIQNYNLTTDRTKLTVISQTNIISSDIRDSNHELILGVSNILERLLFLVDKKNFSKRFSNVEGELENWMHYIEQTLSADMNEFADIEDQPLINE
jgi:hypothetical protein